MDKAGAMFPSATYPLANGLRYLKACNVHGQVDASVLPAGLVV